MRRTLPALCVVAGCAAATGGATDHAIAVTTRPLALDPAEPGRTAVGRLEFRGAVAVEGGGIGGLSGIALLDDGRIVAVGDRGTVMSGRLEADRAGRLTGLSGVAVRPLPHPGGSTDAEDLLHLPDGGWLVAFERQHRILHYPAGLGAAGAGRVAPIVPPPGLESAPANGGIEAMARLPDGRLLVLEEGADDGATLRRAWVAPLLPHRSGDWTALRYRSAPGFRPVGAAVAPGGDLLVLERYVSWIGGWATRVVRVPVARWGPGAVLEGEELARWSLPLLVDNFEAIAATAGPGGETILHLLSDDNFSPLQRTVIARFALAPAAPPGRS